MGAAAVAHNGLLPKKIDLDCFQAIAPEHFSKALFNKLKGSDGFIDLERFITFATKEASDVFITHDWSNDELNRYNHDRAALLNKNLKARALKTWFDEEQMKGDIKEQMADGIFYASCVLVLVT